MHCARMLTLTAQLSVVWASPLACVSRALTRMHLHLHLHLHLIMTAIAIGIQACTA